MANNKMQITMLIAKTEALWFGNKVVFQTFSRNFSWLVLNLTALLDSISVYIEPSPKEREKEERKDR